MAEPRLRAAPSANAEVVDGNTCFGVVDTAEDQLRVGKLIARRVLEETDRTPGQIEALVAQVTVELDGDRLRVWWPVDSLAQLPPEEER